jgi:hypothetical protein
MSRSDLANWFKGAYISGDKREYCYSYPALEQNSNDRVLKYPGWCPLGGCRLEKFLIECSGNVCEDY